MRDLAPYRQQPWTQEGRVCANHSLCGSNADREEPKVQVCVTQCRQFWRSGAKINKSGAPRTKECNRNNFIQKWQSFYGSPSACVICGRQGRQLTYYRLHAPDRWIYSYIRRGLSRFVYYMIFFQRDWVSKSAHRAAATKSAASKAYHLHAAITTRPSQLSGDLLTQIAAGRAVIHSRRLRRRKSASSEIPVRQQKCTSVTPRRQESSRLPRALEWEK